MIDREEKTDTEERGPLELANRGGVLLPGRSMSWSRLRTQTGSRRAKQLQEDGGEPAL